MPDPKVPQTQALVGSISSLGFLAGIVAIASVNLDAGWVLASEVSALVAGQWLLHEMAHLHVAQKLTLKPGWRVLIPFVGAQVATRDETFLRREDEALVALSGILTGLVAATALLAYGAVMQSVAMVVAAKIGFVFNLVSLLPFRPFDGSRIFPGYLWRYANDEEGLASRRLISFCRRMVSFVSTDEHLHPRDVRTVLADAITIVLFACLFVLAATWLVMPPIVFAVALLAAFAGLWAFIAALLQLDMAVINQPNVDALQPRRVPPSVESSIRDLPWQNRTTALASLGIYLIAVSACVAGSLAV